MANEENQFQRQPTSTPPIVQPTIATTGSNLYPMLPPIQPVIQTNEDYVARAIEKRAEITLVEYEYYMKLLKDRLRSSDRERLSAIQPTETRSAFAPVSTESISRPIPVHTPNATPTDIVRSWLKQGKRISDMDQSTSSVMRTPTAMESSPYPTSSLKRTRSITPPSQTTGIENRPQGEEETIFLDKQVYNILVIIG